MLDHSAGPPAVTRSKRTSLGSETNPDVMIVSFPKSGRTWVRVFLSRYRQNLLGLGEFELALHRRPGERGVTYDFSHAGSDPKFGVLRWRKFIMRNSGTRPFRNLPTWLYGIRPIRIPDGAGRYLFLVRDPRDILVSFYHQARSRNRFWSGSKDAFARHPHIGIGRIVALMNHLAGVSGRLNASFLFYEDIRADPEKRFRELLAAAGDELEPALLREAVTYASFENMRRMEETGNYGKRLRAWRRGDPNSLKTRKARPQGYRDELTPEITAYVEDYLYDHLDPFFGQYIYRT